MFFPEKPSDRAVVSHLLWLQPILVLDVKQDGLLLDEQLDYLDVASLAGAHQTACKAELLARQGGSLLQQASHHFCLHPSICYAFTTQSGLMPLAPITEISLLLSLVPSPVRQAHNKNLFLLHLSRAGRPHKSNA